MHETNVNATRKLSRPGAATSTLLGALLWTVHSMVRPFIRMSDRISGWGVLFKVRLLTVFGVILPALFTLALVESHPGDVQLMAAVILVCCIVGFGPLTSIVSHLLIRKQLKEIDQFCLRLKQGDYHVGFDLPHEKDEEPELVALKRNLNWMAHVISRRELRLHAALEGAHEDKTRYETLSNSDPLTGLANRRHFEKRLVELARESAITKRPLSLMFIDCDKFKHVNDTHGHQAGDALLQTLAAIIRCNVREHMDLPFRYGGDEFGVICVGVSIEQASEAAERIRTSYRQQRVGDTTLSIGVASFHSLGRGQEAESAMALINAADKAAYQAKRAGGNRVYLADEQSLVSNHDMEAF